MKYAAKLLSKTDLTLFESYYRLNQTAHQKGTNLNGAVLAEQLFPHLPSVILGSYERAVVLDIYGPDGASLQRQKRKIIKPEGGKNWRLNGKLIEAPNDDLDRYASVAEGDVAVFGFEGGDLPDSVSMVVLSNSSDSDRSTLEALREELGLKRGARSMAVLNLADLERLAAGSPPGHPLRLLLPDPSRTDDLSEAAVGDQEAVQRLDAQTKSGTTRPVSAAELEAARVRAQEVGRAGEVLINSHLDRALATAGIASFEWTADKNAVSPYDFTVGTSAATEFWDAKSTTGKFEAPFHVSTAELKFAVSSEAYRIARVFGVDGPTEANFRLSEPIRALAGQVLKELAALPIGVTVSSVQISPSLLAWGDEHPLPSADDDLEDD